ncbi:hypothetical protein B0H13DRAFT_2269655 [Mycena leptocephala]|nr:hypothetical protein B0H13DRAFT_2269655 [Mycena leptocephala]
MPLPFGRTLQLLSSTLSTSHFTQVAMSASGAESADPTFPEDLERCIFESAALFHPDCIPALLLVAHRVKIWQVPFVQFGFYMTQNNVVFRIEPLFYKVVTIYGPRGPKAKHDFSAFSTCILQLHGIEAGIFLPHNARHIQLVGVPIAEILKALAACNAIINLALFDVSCIKGDTALLDLLGTFSLQRLSARHNYWLNPDSPRLQPSSLDPRIVLVVVADRQAEWETDCLIPGYAGMSVQNAEGLGLEVYEVNDFKKLVEVNLVERQRSTGEGFATDWRPVQMVQFTTNVRTSGFRVRPE